MATVVITGGTGLVGSALTALLLRREYEVIVLTRNGGAEKLTSAGIHYAEWDIQKQTIDSDAIRKADHIIHLAGAAVAEKRWTAKRKKEIVTSRTNSSALLVKALREIPNEVKTVVSASAIGWYGRDPQIPNPTPFIETDKPATDFLGESCRLWENSIDPVTDMGKRLVILRTGIVLSGKGGALAEFRKPIRLGMAAILGSGTQVISWIHIDDLCRMYADALEEKNMRGVFNAVAPNPVNNKHLTLELAKDMKGKFFLPIPVPSFALKIVLGEMSEEVLKSATVSAEKIRKAGFQFLFPTVELALKDFMHE